MPRIDPARLDDFLLPSETPTVVPLTEGAIHESAALVADGRVIYVSTIGSDVVQGYAPNLDLFFADGSVAEVTTIFAGYTHPRTTVFTVDGELYLAVSWVIAPDDTGSGVGRVRIYKSPGGLGGDWVLHGTLQSFPWGNVDFGNRNVDASIIGVPEILPSGRWVLSAPVWTNNDVTVKARGMRLGAYTSDDAGATWTLRLNVGYYLSGGTNGYGFGRNIARAAGGRLWWSSSGNVEADRHAFSDDDGTTWTTASNPTGNACNFGLTDGTLVYDFRALGEVFATADPSVDAGTLVRDYALGGEPYHSLVQSLGSSPADVPFVSSHGRCLGGRRRGGWRVGMIGVA